MTSVQPARESLPEAVGKVLDEFARSFSLDLKLWRKLPGDPAVRLYPVVTDGAGSDGAASSDPASNGAASDGADFGDDSTLVEIPTRALGQVTLEIGCGSSEAARTAAPAVRTALEHLFDYSEEVRFFTYEVSERYEEINLLYSISETLGSLLHMKDASRSILVEVCDVMAARRGSLWVFDPKGDRLQVVASVGEDGLSGPIATDHPSAVTARVFREGRPLILTGEHMGGAERIGAGLAAQEESVLSVPIRYTPPGGEGRTIGVINLIGHRAGDRFTASDQKLLSAIASQVGAALENNRLIRESLERERVSREMEIAHDLQMKLLPTAESFDPERVAARVEPAQSVGGDFFHFFRIPENRIGVMIGDVSGHGFPAALIMALSMSAATIYASELRSPAAVLHGMSQALMDELETTEMYLTLFYGVVDPERKELVYANAGHPHAVAIRANGEVERLEAMDPPMGIGGSVEYGQRSVPWEPGQDLLLLFTDGLSDSLVEGSRRAGEERVLSEAVRLRGRPVREIVRALFDLEGAGDLDVEIGDDRTAVALRA